MIRFWPWAACFCIACLYIGPAQAAITTIGNLNPPYPGGDPWNVGGPLYVAYTADGGMTVNDTSDVIDTDGKIGHFNGLTGAVVITDSESTWENTEDLSLGSMYNSGVGYLTISNNGKVYVGDAASSMLTNAWLIASDSDGSGASGGHLYVYNGSTLTNGGGVTLGSDTGEYGWATVDGTGSSWTNSMVFQVGYRGSGTLTLQNGGSVSNTHGSIGLRTIGTGTVTIDGNGSSWTNSASLSVGSAGSGALTVQNSGSVSNTDGWIGSSTGGTGTATVTGSLSTWENTGNLSLGHSSDSGVGTLTISDGGTVFVGDAASIGGTASWLTVSDSDGTGSTGGHLYVHNGSTLNHGHFATVGDGAGEYGWAMVDGTGSSWTNGESLYVGYFGSGTLTVQNGGSVFNRSGRLGYLGGSDGTVTVDGTGSSWTNESWLYVGENGSGTLTVQNGGSFSSTYGWIAYSLGSDGTVTVDGIGSSWTNSESLYVGDGGSGTLTVSGGGSVSNTYGSIGSSTGGTGTVTVDGSGSSWNNSQSLSVGSAGSGTLTVSNSGSVSNTYGSIGRFTDATGTATVTGSGSTWENTGNLSLGNSSDSGVGSLTISDGGTVYVGNVANIGGSSGRLTVSDSDSSGTDGGHLYIYNGSTLTHGDDAVLGDDADEYGWATVDGSGSSWTNDGELSVGLEGSGTLTVQNGGSVSNTESLYVGLSDSGTLTVQNGGSVSNTNGLIGYATSATGTATIGGTGSTWTNDGWLYVGVAGSGELTVHNGGRVSNTDAWIGSYTGGTGTVMVTGHLSTWENTGNLSLGDSSDSGVGSLTTLDNGKVYVGDAASSGGILGWRMTVSDSDGSGASGGHLYVYNGSTLIHGGDAVLGDDAGEFGWATVDGSGSSWTNGGTLFVGFAGSGTLTIQNGGSVSSAFGGWIGYSTGATGTGTVDGADSTWENSENLSLGRSSGGGVGHLTISNGGTVYVGDAASSGGTAGYLIVSDSDGSGASGGHLFIYNGSTLNNSDYAVLGDDAGEFGWATVDGTGSSWTNGGSLFVGGSASGTLTIQNGGSVSNINGHLGYYTGGTGTATVTGNGSTWENTRNLSLGNSSDSGIGSLTISGGTVYVGDAASSGATGWLTVSSSTVGGNLYVYNGSTLTHGGSSIVGNGSGEFGWATIDGNGSTWTNGGSLYVGSVGSGTLTVQNGGSVSNSGWLYVGDDGSGTLIVQNGGTISNTLAWLAYSAGSTGTATVDGTASAWTNSGSLAVGDNGSGTLTVSDGGSVSSASGRIGYSSGSDGAVTVDGIESSWTNGGSLTVGRSGQGTLTITDGGLVSIAGTLTIDWDTDGDSYINMKTGGMLALFGDADDSLSAFLDLINGTDAINYWDDSVPDWADISGAMRCRDYMLNYLTSGDLSGYTLLTVRHTIDGDANGDGSVDVSDLGILATNYGAGGGFGWCGADFNGDGVVNVSDLGILATNYGKTAALAVPEPGTLTLLATCGLALLGLIARGRNR